MSSPTHFSSSNFSQHGFDSRALPPLPRIDDGRLLKQIFTHRSLARKPKRSFEDTADDPSPDNEQCVYPLPKDDSRLTRRKAGAHR